MTQAGEASAQQPRQCAFRAESARKARSPRYRSGFAGQRFAAPRQAAKAHRPAGAGLYLIALGFAIAALLLAIAAPAVAARPPVTLDGFDGVVPRMTVAQVEARLGVDLDVDTIGPGSACGTARLRLPGLGGYALFMNGRLGSLWFDRGARTDRGVGIGSTAAALARAYPRSRSRPDKYVEEARNVFVRRAAAPHWRLRFDVSPKGKVTGIAFGDDTVFLVEGCA